MAKQDISIDHLVAKVRQGEIVLPEMQRRYVWTSLKVRDLLDSLYRKYPSGTILVWENDNGGPSRALDIDQDKSPYSTKLLLLDGQQRLTSLTALMSGQAVIVKNSRRPVEIMFNLDHPEDVGDQSLDLEYSEDEIDGSESEEDDEADVDEELEGSEIQDYLKKMTFVVYSKALAGQKNWIRVTDVFQKSDAQILKAIGLNSDHELWDKYQKRIQNVREIKNYTYVMHILGKEYDYNEVTEIFVRVNSAGVKLRSSDLALAQITAKWHGSLKIFEGYIKEAKEFGYDLDVGHIVRGLVVYATEQSRFKTVNSLSKEKIQNSWEKTKSGVNFALNFLKNNTQIESIGLLSSPFVVFPIAALSTQRSERLSSQEEKLLARWVYLAHAFGHYSKGSSESILDADISTILKKSGDVNDLLEILQRQFGRLKFDQGDMKRKGIRSPLFSMAYLAVRKSGGKDWFTGLGISKHLKGKFHKIEFHHIFPRKLLQEANYEKWEINEIANMAFISGRTNRTISAKEPRVYLEDIVRERGEDALKAQFVPLDRSLWTIDRYREFLDARRELLIEAINKFFD
jgi:hypothetical protein